VGVFSVAANIIPRKIHVLCCLYLSGRVSESLALQLRYLTLINALFTDVNPVPVKEALNLMGYEAGPCRLPLTEITPAARRALEDQLKAHHLIG
jgi:4-hydroxy-tetrahydrodipicolinate synthase